MIGGVPGASKLGLWETAFPAVSAQLPDPLKPFLPGDLQVQSAIAEFPRDAETARLEELARPPVARVNVHGTEAIDPEDLKRAALGG